MVVPIIIGAALIAAGTVGNFIAGSQRKRAMRRALAQRRNEVAGFDAERTQNLEAFNRGLGPLSDQSAQNSVNALQGLGQASTQAFEQGQQQGLTDIDAGAAEVFGQAPVGADFNPQTGAGTGALRNIQAQLAPSQEAARNLSAGGLGRLAQDQATQGVLRDNAFANIDVQNSLQNLNQFSALQSADTGLRDLNSNLAYQNATQRAGNKGSNLSAISGLAQQVGGGLMSFGATTAVKK